MKYDEHETDARKLHESYITERWSQLSQIEMDWTTDAIKYLFLINAGASAAILTFIGAVEGVRGMYWPWLMLLCFTLGIICVGFIHVIRVRRVDYLYSNWRSDVRDYYDLKICWDKLVNDDDTRAYKFDLAYICGYSGFALFILGVIVGAVNFQSLNKGDENGQRNQKTEQAVTRQTTDTTVKTGTVTAREDKRTAVKQERWTDSRVSNPPTATDHQEIAPAQPKEKQ